MGRWAILTVWCVALSVAAPGAVEQHQRRLRAAVDGHPVFFVDPTITDTNAASATPDCTTYDARALACGAGTSSAYASLADLNAITKTAGMEFSLRRGQTFRGVVTISESGAAGRYVALSAYGTGARPDINGSLLLTSWTLEGSNYYATAPQEPFQVFENSLRYTSVALKASIVAGTFWWDSVNSRVYIRTTGSDNPSGYTIEADQGAAVNGVIQAFGQSYLSVTGIKVQKAAYGLWLFGASSHNVVTDVEAALNLYDGIGLSATTDATVTGGESHDNGRCGIGAYSAADRSTVTGATVHHNAEGLGDLAAGGGLCYYQVTGGLAMSVVAYNNLYGIKAFDSATTDITVRACEAYNNTWFGVNFDFTGSGMTVEQCYVHGNIHGIAVEGTTPGAAVLYNYATGNGASAGSCGIEVSSAPNTIVIYNVVWNETNGICAFYEPSGLRLWQNTVVKTTDACFNFSVNTTNPDNWNFQNNIGADCGAYVLDFGAWAVTTFGSDTNVWYHTGGTQFARSTSTSYDLATWKGFGLDTSSVNSDPLFTNQAAGVLTLTAPSPASNTGANLGAPYSVGLVAGTSWPRLVATASQVAWDIGAYIGP